VLVPGEAERARVPPARSCAALTTFAVQQTQAGIPTHRGKHCLSTGGTRDPLGFTRHEH